jgi:4-hydroxy-tetrahydrodipicolinate synthase
MLEGILPIVPTPFDEEGRLDPQSIEKLTLFMCERGVHGVAVLGVMGEASKLTETEREEVVGAFRSALPRNRALVVGITSAATWPAIKAATRAQAQGADALLLGPPPVQSDDVIFAFYAQVAREVSIPIVVHDYPPSTGVILSPHLLARLHRELPSVRYVKLEDPPTGPKIDYVRRLGGSGFGVFGALGGLYALEELERGVLGIMTGFAYPELLVRLYTLYRGGEVEAAADLFYTILPLVRFEFQPGLGVAIRKEILRRRGAIRSATVRHPGALPDEMTLGQLDRILGYLAARRVIEDLPSVVDI